jgi:hypothetical protein
MVQQRKFVPETLRTRFDACETPCQTITKAAAFAVGIVEISDQRVVFENDHDFDRGTIGFYFRVSEHVGSF